MKKRELTFQVNSIGYVEKTDQKTAIKIDSGYGAAMAGLTGFSHINVFYWFDQNDTPDKRAVRQVHPCRNPDYPLTGVFATHSPLRPNLIGMSLCEIEKIEGTTIWIDRIDALDGSPVIDIKCYIPTTRSLKRLRLPPWAETARRNRYGK
jgi:tRNA-Thr(GGU) m(6)t(6)A37 methyltransferase TsaA